MAYTRFGVRIDGTTWIFDCAISIDHQSSMDISTDPSDTEKSSDNATRNPHEVTATFKQSDTATSVVKGQFSGPGTRSQEAYKVLYKAFAAKKQMQLITKYGTYSDMMIVGISVPEDETTPNALNITVMWEERMPTQKTETKTTTSSGKSTGSTKKTTSSKSTKPKSKGKPEPTKPNQSILKQIAG